MPNTLFNGADCSNILFNGQDCNFVYINGVLVFQNGGDFAIEECKNYQYTYSSYAQNLNADSAQIGRVSGSSGDHMGVWFKVKVPSNFNAGSGSLKLKFYRTAGSAQGSVTVGCTGNSWTDNLTWNLIYYQASANEVSGTASASEGWKEVDISGLMQLIANNVNSDGYVVMNIKSEGAYMFINANPNSENAPQIVWQQ